MQQTSPKHYALLYRAIYFFLFAGIGIAFPYLNLYFKRIGLSGSEIGIVTAIRPAVGLFFVVYIGRLHDRLGGGGMFPAILVLISTVTFMLYPLNSSFIYVAAITLMMALSRCGVIPIADSSCLRHLHLMPREANYGNLRVAGTISFMITCYFVGLAISRDIIGIEAIFPLYAGCMIALPFLFARIPAATKKGKKTGRLRSLLARKAIVLFLFATLFSRMAQSGAFQFLSIYFDELGAGEDIIGISWVVATVVEAFVLLYAERIKGRIGVRGLIALGIGASIIRWILTGVIDNIPVLVAIQSLHGLTFGAFYVGAVMFMDRNTPSHLKSSGQTLYWMVHSLAMMCGNLLAGFVYDSFGVEWIFIVCAVLSTIGLVIFLPVLLKKR